MQTWGSRGDVAPFVALAAGLRSAGHQVTLAVTTDESTSYVELAERLGIELVHVHSGFGHAPPTALRRIVRTADRLKEVELLNRYFFDPAIDDLYEASKALCASNDVVVGHFWVHTLATAATLAGVPRVVVHFCPIGVRSRYLPAIGPDLGPWLNGPLWDLGDLLMRRRLFRAANALRKREGLAPFRSVLRELFVSDELTLVAASPLLCPRPPDWGGNVEVSGFLTLPHVPAAEELSADLEAFLEAGEPPVVFTFGSCDILYGADNARLFVDTVARTGRRAIIQSGRAGAFADRATDGLRLIERADHARLFPRCSLVVHHGGAGTTHTALRSGVPAVVVEHGFDQAYWGRALVNAGVSPRRLHRRSVTPARLARAVTAALDEPACTENARRLGRTLAAEDGVATAVELIGRRFGAR